MTDCLVSFKREGNNSFSFKGINCTTSIIDRNLISIKKDWISIEEQKPEFNKPVLATNVEQRNQWVALRRKLNDDYEVFEPTIFSNYDSDFLYKVTHWMELPEPPQENEHQ